MRTIVLFPVLLAIAPAEAARSGHADRLSPDHLSYVLVTSHGNSMMSGSSDDFRRVKAFRVGNAPMLYVRRDGAGYLIRDPDILRRAAAIMKPQQDLGDRQGQLGDQQGKLGNRQGQLGEQQGRLGERMADSTPRQMEELGRHMDELGRQQEALGDQQEALGRRQEELGREQERLAELAQPQLEALVNDAIRRGLARRVD